MTIVKRFGTAALLAAAVLAGLTGLASARNRVEVRPNGLPLINLTSEELTIAEREIFGISVICEVTLGASLHRLIAKVRGSLLGYISDGRMSGCRSGIAEREPELIVTPEFLMHVQYDSITGTLPTITGGRLRIGFRFLIRREEGRTGCQYAGNVDVTARENPINRLTIERVNNTVARVRTLTGLCAERRILEGTLTSERPIEVVLLER